MEASGDRHLHFRSVLSQFATGVAVVTGINNQRPLGITIQSFCSLSLNPPLILICPALTSTSWPTIAACAGLCVNLLAESREDLALQFAKSGGDKFAGVAWEPSAVTHSPILVDALAWIDCRIANVYPGGDHSLVVCEVLALEARTDLRPLIFFKSGFGRMSG